MLYVPEGKGWVTFIGLAVGTVEAYSIILFQSIK